VINHLLLLLDECVNGTSLLPKDCYELISDLLGMGGDDGHGDDEDSISIPSILLDVIYLLDQDEEITEENRKKLVELASMLFVI
jgi:hypothetical protein